VSTNTRASCQDQAKHPSNIGRISVTDQVTTKCPASTDVTRITPLRGAPGGTRTPDPRTRSPNLIDQLSLRMGSKGSLEVACFERRNSLLHCIVPGDMAQLWPEYRPHPTRER
jgi:hypothetical protein